MKTPAVVLFVLGILLAVGAFLGDKADNVPFVLNLLAPEYTKAQVGLAELEKKMTLSPEDYGFEELANIFLLRIERQNPPDRLAGVTITKIQRQSPMMVFGKLRASEVVKFSFSLSNGQTLDWPLDKLSEELIALKTRRIFWFSNIIFFGGILIQVVGFIMQVRKTRKNFHIISTTDQPAIQADRGATTMEK